MLVLPFCECFHKPDYEGGRPLGKDDDGALVWQVYECVPLDNEQVYVEVAAHRKACLVQPDLLSRSEPKATQPGASGLRPSGERGARG